MLDDQPIVRERLLATATFAAIALGTLAALDFLVTGGFDFGARRTASSYGSPLIGASSPILGAEPADSTVTALAWSDPLAVEEKEQTAEEQLDPAAATEPGGTAPSGDQLYRAIAQLYLDQDASEDETVRTSDGERGLEGGDDGIQALYDERDLRPDPNAPDSEP
ncbi:MAG: hypothetical protein ACREH4_11345 [Vitreimonas sp.]